MATGPSAATIFSNTLDVLKGWSPYMVDKQVPLASLTATGIAGAGGTAAHVRAGMVGHIVSTGADQGKFDLGFSGSEVPIFIRNSGDDNDTNPFVDTALGNASLQGTTFGSAGPIVSGVVGIDGFELETTEFVAGATIGSMLEGATGADYGKVKEVLAGGANTSICGIVSEVPATNHNGVTTLRFWTHFQIGSGGMP